MIKRIGQFIALIFLLFTVFYLYQTYRNVQNVLSYRSLVQEVLAENDTVANEELVLAMIYTETKGNAADLMQSSESSTGVANSITDNKESVRQGVSVLSENLTEAGQQGVDVWTAVQAYNFGKNYIAYVAKNGKANTITVAKKYSKTVVAPSLGNTEGLTYRYYNPIALYYGGGELYQNGGNIYYSRQVQFNLVLIKMLSDL